MTDTPNTPGNRTGRTLRVVLFVSLALNLLVVGLVAGAIASGRAGDKPRVEFNLGPVARALTEEDRRALRDTLRNNHDIRPPSPRDRRRDIEAMIALLRADEFDIAAMTELLAKQREVGTRFVTVAHEALVAHVAAASPEARASFADRLESELRSPPARSDQPPRREKERRD